MVVVPHADSAKANTTESMRGMVVMLILIPSRWREWASGAEAHPAQILTARAFE